LGRRKGVEMEREAGVGVKEIGKERNKERQAGAERKRERGENPARLFT
jgi:hypothetical protein